MLKARRRWKGCLKKVVYRDLSDAEDRVREMERDTIYDRMYPNAYPCQFGNHFHVGHGEKDGTDINRAV